MIGGLRVVGWNCRRKRIIFHWGFVAPEIIMQIFVKFLTCISLNFC